METGAQGAGLEPCGLGGSGCRHAFQSGGASLRWPSLQGRLRDQIARAGVGRFSPRSARAPRAGVRRMIFGVWHFDSVRLLGLSGQMNRSDVSRAPHVSVLTGCLRVGPSLAPL